MDSNVSNFDYNYYVVFLGLFIHVISLLIILHIYFHENARKVVGLYITVTAMLSMIYFMINMVSNEILTMMKISDEGNVSSLMSHIILLIYVGGMGKFFEHQYRGKVKKISNKYLFLLGGILLLDALVVAALAEFVISNTQASNKFILISVYSIVVL